MNRPIEAVFIVDPLLLLFTNYYFLSLSLYILFFTYSNASLQKKKAKNVVSQESNQSFPRNLTKEKEMSNICVSDPRLAPTCTTVEYSTSRKIAGTGVVITIDRGTRAPLARDPA